MGSMQVYIPYMVCVCVCVCVCVFLRILEHVRDQWAVKQVKGRSTTSNENM